MLRHCFSLIVLALLAGNAAAQNPDAPARFNVDGNRVLMQGYVDGSTLGRLQRALNSTQQRVRTLVLESVQGSVDDDANLRLCRFVRSRGLNTHVPNYGTVASGGVDLFIAGVQRTADREAYFGVHSWADGNTQGRQVLNDPRWRGVHLSYINYYREMGLPNAQAFYVFTLNAADANNIHQMTQQELRQHGLLTNARVVRGPAPVVVTEQPAPPVRPVGPAPAPSEEAAPPIRQPMPPRFNPLVGTWQEVRNDGRRIMITIDNNNRFGQSEAGRGTFTGRVESRGGVLALVGNDGSRETFLFQRQGNTIRFANQNGAPINRFYWQKVN